MGSRRQSWEKAWAVGRLACPCTLSYAMSSGGRSRTVKQDFWLQSSFFSGDTEVVLLSFQWPKTPTNDGTLQAASADFELLRGPRSSDLGAHGNVLEGIAQIAVFVGAVHTVQKGDSVSSATPTFTLGTP